jgi:hypothetical protein
MEIRFSQSARKHRIGKQRVLFVIANCEAEEFQSGGVDPHRLVWIGVDDRRLELEVIGIRTPSGILIIHVMPLNFRRRRR